MKLKVPKKLFRKKELIVKKLVFFTENGSFPKQNTDHHYDSSQQPPNTTPRCFKKMYLMHFRPLNTPMKTRVIATWRCLRWSVLQWRPSNNEVIYSQCLHSLRRSLCSLSSAGIRMMPVFLSWLPIFLIYLGTHHFWDLWTICFKLIVGSKLFQDRRESGEAGQAWLE